MTQPAINYVKATQDHLLKIESRLLLSVIILNHLYILFLNTSGLHGLPVPNLQVWTTLLVVALLGLAYYFLKEPATTWYEKSLYIAIVLSLGGGFLRIIGFSVDLVSYSLLLIAVAILTTVPLVAHHHKQLSIALLGIYSLEIIQLIARVLNINNVVSIVGPLIELSIVLGILYYNYSLGFMYDELFLVIIATVVGWYLGDFIYQFDVPTLVLATVFDQTLSVGQYSIIKGIEPKFFLSLHLAAVFNLVMVQILARRSWRAVAIVLVGLDMLYPPILGLRAFAILVFLRDTIRNDKSDQPNTTDHTSNPSGSLTDKESPSKSS